MSQLKATATLELAAGEKNLKGMTMKTNRYRVEGDFSGTLYLKEQVGKTFEIVVKA